jgi:zinc transporter
VLQDDLNNRAAAQTNKTSYLLSIVAAIFLPLGFITGLLGMNVGGMPGVNAHDGFWIACAAMAVLVAVQLFVFRKLRWL